MEAFQASISWEGVKNKQDYFAKAEFKTYELQCMHEISCTRWSALDKPHKVLVELIYEIDEAEAHDEVFILDHFRLWAARLYSVPALCRVS